MEPDLAICVLKIHKDTRKLFIKDLKIRKYIRKKKEERFSNRFGKNKLTVSFFRSLNFNIPKISEGKAPLDTFPSLVSLPRSNCTLNSSKPNFPRARDKPTIQGIQALNVEKKKKKKKNRSTTQPFFEKADWRKTRTRLQRMHNVSKRRVGR